MSVLTELKNTGVYAMRQFISRDVEKESWTDITDFLGESAEGKLDG